ncbi:hypothetical protein [Nitrososphaera viennensis]|uniref:Uncharacterized protein n=2 Tax=Nitrososphaera viennensis TaxID=1034015 RepID=A0A060HJI5_9ARCH|nr:hypothetical protein [Nitrososphaera viennensis]AIC16724.1 hypothetical protein NVIE_024610 [Nitrososphaera viennensis EN76]UVS68643.1 hypothetical protein NWT39_12140 [Nitrososphaera viennensis]
MPNKNNKKKKKTIKFHGQEVEDVVVLYSHTVRDKPDTIAVEEFDAAKDPQVCETVNIQVVSEFVTITFYKDEEANSIVRRELIPAYRIEHIWVRDLRT